MKEKIGPYPYLYPVPIVLVGTAHDTIPNYTTVGDVAIMGIGTPLMCISISETALARQNIVETGVFSINVPTVQMLAAVDFCGAHSGKTYHKEHLFTTLFGDNPMIPLIAECPVNMECDVIHDFQEANRHIFIARISQTHIDHQYVTYEDGKRHIANLNALQPIAYALDNHYYSIGEIIGTGYQEGKAIESMILKRK